MAWAAFHVSGCSWTQTKQNTSPHRILEGCLALMELQGFPKLVGLQARALPDSDARPRDDVRLRDDARPRREDRRARETKQPVKAAPQPAAEVRPALFLAITCLLFVPPL